MGKIRSSSKRTKKESLEKALPPWNSDQVKGYLYISVKDNVQAEEKLKNLSHALRACIEAIYQLYGIYDFCIELFGTKEDVESAIKDLVDEFKPLLIKKTFSVDTDGYFEETYSFGPDGLIKYCGVSVNDKQKKCHFHKFQDQTFIPFIIQVSPTHPIQKIKANVLNSIIRRALSMNAANDIIYTVAFNENSAHFMLVVRCNEYYKLNEITKLMDEVVDANNLQKITYPIAGIIHYDVNKIGITWAWEDQVRGLNNTEIKYALQLLDTLQKEARWESYKIVGNYVLSNTNLIGRLSTIKNEIESFVSKDNKDSRNYSYLCTLHGESRNGKSFFVEELGRILHEEMNVDYEKIDLGKKGKRDLVSFLKKRKAFLANKTKVFAFIDEIDTPGKEFAFPMLYNIILDWGKDYKCPIIWFFTGSNGNNITEFIEKIKAKDPKHPKANDFAKRIEKGRKIEIPLPSISDKIIVACYAAKAQNFRTAEKSVLLYFAMHKDTLEAIRDELIGIRRKYAAEMELESNLIGYEDYAPFMENNKKLLQGLGTGENGKIKLD